MIATTLAPARNHCGSLISYDTRDIYTLDPPPLVYLAEGLIVAEALNLCVAREKTGKSMLALGLSLAMAKGLSYYAGLAIRNARVVYIDAENGVNETHRRIRCLSEMPVPPDRFQYLDQGASRFQLDHGHSTYDVLADVVDSYRPDVIVFDSFRSLWSGDENRPGAVASVLDPLRECLRSRGVAGLLLHHANASGDTRGTTAIQACAENITKLTLKNGVRSLRQTPSRFGEVLIRPVTFRILPRSADPLCPLDLVPTTAADTEDMRTQRDWITEVERLLLDGKARSGRQIARDLGVDPTHNGVRQAIQALSRRKAIVKKQDGWRLASVAEGVAGHADKSQNACK